MAATEGEAGSGEDIQLRILTLGKGDFHVTVSSLATVAALKAAIVAQQPQLSAPSLRLMYHGRMLKDDETLDEYSLANGHTVHMVVRPGSSSSPAPAPTAVPQAAQPPAAPAAQLDAALGSVIPMLQPMMQALGNAVAQAQGGQAQAAPAPAPAPPAAPVPAPAPAAAAAGAGGAPLIDPSTGGFGTGTAPHAPVTPAAAGVSHVASASMRVSAPVLSAAQRIAGDTVRLRHSVARTQCVEVGASPSAPPNVAVAAAVRNTQRFMHATEAHLLNVADAFQAIGSIPPGPQRDAVQRSTFAVARELQALSKVTSGLARVLSAVRLGQGDPREFNLDPAMPVTWSAAGGATAPPPAPASAPAAAPAAAPVAAPVVPPPAQQAEALQAAMAQLFASLGGGGGGQ